MSRKKERYVGEITEALPGVDFTGQYPITLLATVRNDEGREYLFHVPPEVIEEIIRLHTDPDDEG